MKALSLLAIVAATVLSALLATLLAISNPEQVTLMIGFLEVNATSGQMLVFAFAFGALAGVGGMLVSILFAQFNAGFLRSRIEKLQSELDSIKTNGLRESL
ncbi:MAG: hypothetical protein KUG76_00375 [Gammaproteobacteria bacterium]|nr:hypothetical protein [Gammaproteobacteria bacterium]